MADAVIDKNVEKEVCEKPVEKNIIEKEKVVDEKVVDAPKEENGNLKNGTVNDADHENDENSKEAEDENFSEDVEPVCGLKRKSISDESVASDKKKDEVVEKKLKVDEVEKKDKLVKETEVTVIEAKNGDAEEVVS